MASSRLAVHRLYECAGLVGIEGMDLPPRNAWSIYQRGDVASDLTVFDGYPESSAEHHQHVLDRAWAETGRYIFVLPFSRTNSTPRFWRTSPQTSSLYS
jgi:hypothetical protein